jgi:hypothetical protein
MGTGFDNRETRIQKIRERAEEIRTAAAEIQNPKVRASMLNIARTYDNTADLLERMLAKDDGAAGSAGR